MNSLVSHFCSTSRCVCMAGRAWVFVCWLSRGFGSSGRRPHRISSLNTSGSGVSGLPQLNLPNSHPAESPTARAFYGGGSGLLRVSDSSHTSCLMQSLFLTSFTLRPYLSKSHRTPEAIIQAKQRPFLFALTRLFR